MEGFRKYRRRADSQITAIQLSLETDGLVYKKWGGEQRGKKGDWLVDNAGDIYTVDAEVFQKTYHNVSPGRYAKATRVWARVAGESGTIKTKEGSSEYRAGDYLVYNDPDDGYCIDAHKFESMYEPDE
jgi:hypothetical protein